MSRLTSITLENFKGYAKSQKIPIKPLTLIFGPNSAGKSSIFHALAFLKYCQSKNDCDPTDKVDLGWESVSLGGISNLVHDHDLSRSMKIGLGFLRADPSGADQKVDTEWQFQNLQSADSKSAVYTASSCKITVNDEQVAVFANGATDGIDWYGHLNSISISEIESLSGTCPQENKLGATPFSGLFDSAWYEFVHGRIFPLGSDNHIEESLSKLKDKFILEFINYVAEPGVHFMGLYPGFQDLIEADSKEQNNYFVWDDILRKMRTGLSSGDLSSDDRWSFFDAVLRRIIRKGLRIPDEMGAEMFGIFQDHIHVGPLRQPPFRDLGKTSLRERKEWQPWVRLIEDQDLRKDVSDALAALGVEYEIIKGFQETRTSFPGSNLQESKSTKDVLRFRATNGKVATSHLDLGFGISTVLPLVVALHSDCALLTIEQPELHIHPRMQTRLGDLLIRKAFGKSGDTDDTVLVETHSEHLILRILRRIRETTECKMENWPEALREVCPQGIRPEDVAVLYIQPGEDGPEVIELPITPRGGFYRPWPGGFFEEKLEELL